eukprot:GHVH01012614.1.p1 GENE.GHVH01012614.1~~GHVH01012614.1.p1  ORF type:complete len:102 (+),score=16.39 GHVH01012614.1:531-836(+)
MNSLEQSSEDQKKKCLRIIYRLSEPSNCYCWERGYSANNETAQQFARKQRNEIELKWFSGFNNEEFLAWMDQKRSERLLPECGADDYQMGMLEDLTGVVPL